MLKFKTTRKAKFAIFGLVCALAISVWTFWFWHEDISVFVAELGVYFRDSVHFLEDVPLICYSLVIFALPLFFLPVSPIFILASARAAESSYLVVLFFCLLGVTLNVVAAYFVSRKFGFFLRKKLSARGINIPEIPSYEQYELTFLMRMIPGNPLAVQNYVLGAANVSFFKYVVVSLPIQYVQIAAYVWFGEGIFEGGISKLVLGSSFLMALAVIARMLDKRYGYKLRRRNKNDGLSKTE